jgi:hypothetical protein
VKRLLCALSAVAVLSLGFVGLGTTAASANPNPGSSWTHPCNGSTVGWLDGQVGNPNYEYQLFAGNYNYSWNQGWLVVWWEGWPFWTYYWNWC